MSNSRGIPYTGTMTGGGIRYLNIDSLGKDSPYSYGIIAVDCNGVSSVPATVGTWPVVLITAPVDRTLGATANPYAYSVPAAADSPIRALVFDAVAVSSVLYRIDAEATWHPMSPVAGDARLYEGIWNASTLAPGDHAITVQALGTTTRSHSITVTVDPAVSPNEPPVAANDAYAANEGTMLGIAAPGVLANDTDADGDPLTASLVGPANGVLALNADGSFNYTPNPGFSGIDSFLYAANDGTVASAAATVLRDRAGGRPGRGRHPHGHIHPEDQEAPRRSDEQRPAQRGPDRRRIRRYDLERDDGPVYP
ncbi:MAG: cadherin-like domain-containing protein [Candidatus Moduliflexus flocculans]|nr:cadherin-like domain-containing protein [Candidatus Moduliflexus flocculans]